MQALVYTDRLRLEAHAKMPIPGPGDALIRVLRAGICGTDLEIIRGYKGFQGILGHEFVGTVVEVADPDLIGRRVCGEINVTCGGCSRCRTGLQSHCSRRRVLGILGLNGAFAEYLSLPARNLHTIPDALSDDAAVFVEPLAAAMAIVDAVEVGPGTRCVVLGDGKLGILCAQAAARSGASVVLVGKHARNLAVARRLGIQTSSADGTLDPDVDVVVEATGSRSGIGRALEIVRPKGTVVVKSTTSSHNHMDLTKVVVDEIRIVGSRCGSLPAAIAALTEGRIRVTDLIARRFPLTQGVQAMQEAMLPGMLKVVLDMSAAGRNGA